MSPKTPAYDDARTADSQPATGNKGARPAATSAGNSITQGGSPGDGTMHGPNNGNTTTAASSSAFRNVGGGGLVPAPKAKLWKSGGTAGSTINAGLAAALRQKRLAREGGGVARSGVVTTPGGQHRLQQGVPKTALKKDGQKSNKP